MENQSKYYAFISYSHKDSKWAKWLQHELEYYQLPSSLNGREDLPTSFRPIFRDEDELAGGNLKPQISSALASTEFLIVICSPNSSYSSYVNDEIKEYIEIGKIKGEDYTKRIFPFIIAGKPHQPEGDPDECFPPILNNLKDVNGNKIELIAGDVNATNRDHAFVKILAGTLREKRVQFSELWDRHAQYKIEEEERKRKEKDRLSLVESRFLAGKAMESINASDSYLARLLALYGLPKNKNDDRPLCTEAEYALRLADIKDSALIKGHKESVGSIDITKNGEIIVSSSYDNTIRFFSAIDGSPIGTIHLRDNIHAKNVLFNHDGTKIACALSDNTIKIWDICINNENHISINKVSSIANLSSEINYFSFNSNGSKIVAAYNDGTVKIWDTLTHQQIGTTLKGHVGRVYKAIYSDDDKFIITCGFDKTIRIWDSELCVQIGEPLWGHTKWVGAISVHSNILISASHLEQKIRIWDLNKREERLTPIEFQSGINDVDISKDGTKIVIALSDGSVRIWDLIANTESAVFKGHTHFVNVVKFSENGESIISGSWDGTIRKWDVHEKPIVESFVFNKIDNIVKNMSLDNNGQRMIYTDISGNIYFCDNINTSNAVKLCNKISTLAQLTPDGTAIIYICGKDLYTMDIVSGITIHESSQLDIHKKDINSLCFSDSGSMLATTSMDKTIIIWDRKCLSITKRHILIGHEMAVRDAAFSPDETLLASAGADSTIRIWQCNSGEQYGKEIKVDKDVIVECLSFSPNGNHIVAGTNKRSLHIYDVLTQKTVVDIYNAHDEQINCVVYSCDGRYIASASNDKKINIWDAISGKPIISSLYGHSDFVNSVKFISGTRGYNFISCSSDGTIRLWNFETLEQIVQKNRRRFGNRSFSQDEKDAYYLE